MNLTKAKPATRRRGYSALARQLGLTVMAILVLGAECRGSERVMDTLSVQSPMALASEEGTGPKRCWAFDGYRPDRKGYYHDEIDKAACAAILESLNLSCDAPRQSNTRTISPSNPDLSEATWERLEPSAHAEMVTKTFLAATPPAGRTPGYIASIEANLNGLLQRGELLLERSDLDFDSDGTVETLYRLRLKENDASAESLPWFRTEASYFVAARGSTDVPSAYSDDFMAPTGTVWRFREGRWYFINFVAYLNRTVVTRAVNVMRATPGRLDRCAFRPISRTR